MKKILSLLTISLLIACSGGGSQTPTLNTPSASLGGGPRPPPPPPPPPPVPVEILEVEITGSGDRFYPVRVDISYTIDNVEQPYDYNLSM